MIVPVKKARVFVLEEQKDDLVVALQKASLLMIIPNQVSNNDTTSETALLQRISKAINDLNRYGKKKSLFGYQTVSYEQFMADDGEQKALLENVEKCVEDLATANAEIKKMGEIHDKYAPFRDIDISVTELKSSTYARYHIGHVKTDDIESVKTMLGEKEVPFQVLSASEYGSALLYASYVDDEETIAKDIASHAFTEVDLPDIAMSIGNYVDDLQNRINHEKDQVKKLETELKNLAKDKNFLELYYDQVHARSERKTISFAKTERAVYIDGWVRVDQIDKLKETVKSITNDFDIEFSDPSDKELPPTALKNNKFVSQFEAITNMFSVPNPREIDPNPFLSVWYWIIFGIMMGDIGYGLAMLGLFGAALWLLKPKGSFKKLIYVFFYSGITSLIAGILFGSFFGAEFDLGALIGSLFGQQWTTVVLNPVTDPLIMLGFSLVFGILHIINGLGLKIALLIRRKDYVGAIADGLSWILVLVGLLFVAGQMVLWPSVSILSYIGLGLAGLGVLILLFLAGRKSKNIFGKIIGGLGAIYQSTGYVSDILSYSRILALSLSSAVIATTMNLLAGMVQGSVIGFIFSLLIYLIGHIFNFAMGLLSAYVHAGRLQYIEFFNKFYEGEGYLFEPFAIHLKHINEISYSREERR